MNVTTAIKTKNPFPGLRPFREDEEHLFFGRENQVDAMVDKLGRTHFLAVVGTSGSGKSSLVNCGLRPGLHGGLMASAGTDWRMAQFRPGKDPIDAMSRALAEDGVLFHDFQSDGLPLSEIMDTTVRMSKLGLVDMYQQAQLPKDTNLLVVVDQFEELFRYQQNDGEKQEGVTQEAVEFVNLLLEAAEQTKYPIYIVLTMRSDFLGDCAQFRGLVEAINDGQYLVPRMTREERRAAIAGPVAVGGAEISPVLLTRLVNDVGDNPDQLSILQHALNRTWAHWENDRGVGKIDLPHYEAIGTMAHALDQHAEKAYAELTTERQQQVCKKIFQALTDKATDPRGTRRPTMMIELGSLADATPEEVKQVIEVFRKPSRSFLMPPAGEALEPGTIVDISHESLMRVWKRLNKWADEEAESAVKFRRIAEAAALQAEGKASLWQDPDLQLAVDWRNRDQPNEIWAKRYHSGFAEAEHFLDASLAERNRNRIRKTILAAAIPLIVLFAMAIILYVQGKEKQRLDDYTDARDKYNAALDLINDGKLESAIAELENIADTQNRFYLDDQTVKSAEYYSDTLVAIGNAVDAPIERKGWYDQALVIRKDLAEKTPQSEEKWPRFQRKHAMVQMNIANSQLKLKNFSGSEASFLSAQDILRNLLKPGSQLSDTEKFHVSLDLAKGFVNFKRLYKQKYKEEQDDYRKQYYALRIMKYAQQAFEELKDLNENGSDEVSYILAASKFDLGFYAQSLRWEDIEGVLEKNWTDEQKEELDDYRSTVLKSDIDRVDLVQSAIEELEAIAKQETSPLRYSYYLARLCYESTEMSFLSKEQKVANLKIGRSASEKADDYPGAEALNVEIREELRKFQ